MTLLLNIVASSEESSVKSSRGRTAFTSRHLSKKKRDVLEIKFRSEDGEFALWQSHCSAANWIFANFRILLSRLCGLQSSAWISPQTSVPTRLVSPIDSTVGKEAAKRPLHTQNCEQQHHDSESDNVDVYTRNSNRVPGRFIQA